MSKTIVLIPSRMSAKRLPGKPLLKINNISIISHVVKKAKQAKIGEVYVATDSVKILNDVRKNGGKAILTKKSHKTGTDRIFEAFKKLSKKNIKYIINLQGDEPGIRKNDIIKLNKLMLKNNCEVGTVATKIKNKKILLKENFVKVETEKKLNNNNFSRALDFFRKSSSKSCKNIYHHMGIYAYNVKTLKKIVHLKQSKNEKKLRLEQMRALDNNVSINVSLSKYSSFGIDTIKDYLAMKKIMEYKSRI